jgi:DNA-binding transcriptional regulator YbjK
MAFIDKLRQELDRAGRSAQRAIDEGRLRLDLYRARQSVDRFAQRLGYAVFHARKAGGDLSADDYTAHMNNLTAAESEVTRLETLVAEAAKSRRDTFKPIEPPQPSGP